MLEFDAMYERKKRTYDLVAKYCQEIQADAIKVASLRQLTAAGPRALGKRAAVGTGSATETVCVECETVDAGPESNTVQ